MTVSAISPIQIASKHPIIFDGPAVDFFEGALLGNGGLGVVVTTRPDAVVLRFGHNNVWDVRVAESHRDKVGTFKDVFARVSAIPKAYARLEDDAWYRQYVAMTKESYDKSYPRPFPCGLLLLGFDRRRVELLGHRLDIATGLCEVRFLVEAEVVTLKLFVEMEADRLWLQMVDEAGQPTAGPFDRVRLIPDPDTPEDMPPYAVPTDLPAEMLAFRQVLPFQEAGSYDKAVGHRKDRAFSLAFRCSNPLTSGTRLAWHDVVEELGPLERAHSAISPFTACVQLHEGLASAVALQPHGVPLATEERYEAAAQTARTAWERYWNKSGVALEDGFLERIWYRNLYFFNCSVKAGTTCPGLFANWSYRDIGTAWHGDYHMNYNTQQPFWLAFSSNHVDKHLAYVGMVYHILPVSRMWAERYYGLRGAYFPHSAYPVEMNTMPYPAPTWGWEICETPWTVQSLWWHYSYTLDREFLEQRAFEPIREAVLFLVDYMTRPGAHGESWGDDNYHIFPTVPPELYGLRPGFEKNYDCLVDLTLTKFVFKAFLKACSILEREEAERELIGRVQAILEHFPAYPTAASTRGEVFVSVPGEDPEVVYNTPNSVMTVFPGEEHGLHSPADQFEIAANSYHNHRNEGGNELVFLNLAGARLGLLNLERFKRQIRYCMLPNGTCTDKVLQVHGRYHDTRPPFDFMARMGIWFENFALPVVVNESLLQSYTGSLRFFPNWPLDKEAEFRTLRAVGAFLVSARCERGEVSWIEVFSEVGAPLRVVNPWATGAKCLRTGQRTEETVIREALIDLTTAPGETVRLTKA